MPICAYQSGYVSIHSSNIVFDNRIDENPFEETRVNSTNKVLVILHFFFISLLFQYISFKKVRESETGHLKGFLHPNTVLQTEKQDKLEV